MAEHFVHIIESPSADDIFDGRTEGGTLREALRLAGIPSWYRIATTVNTFDRCLQSDLVAGIKHHSAKPFLHISAHGHNDGIALTDSSFITWQQLRDRLLPINSGLGGSLLITMSSCFGGAGCRMAMHDAGQPLPFHAIVGHYGEPTWSDAAIAFVAFYHRVFKHAGINAAMDAMKAASGDQGWNIFYGDDVQDGWVRHMQRQSVTQLLNRLGAMTAAAPEGGAAVPVADQGGASAPNDAGGGA